MRLRTWLRALAALLILGLAVLTAFWLLVRNEFGEIIEGWKNQMRALGYEVAAGSPEYGGWPLKLEARFSAPVITGPEGERWEGPALVTGHAWLWDVETVVIEGPGRHRLEVEGGPLVLEIPEGALTLGFSGGALDRVALSASQPVVSNETSGRRLALQELAFDVAPLTPGSDGRHATGFAFTLSGFALPPETEPAITLLGPEIALLRLEGELRGQLLFDQSWKDFLFAWRESGGVLDFEGIQLEWGELWLQGDGTLAIDERFRPLGAFGVETLGLPELVGRATSAGLLDKNDGETLERALVALATDTDGHGRKRVRLPITMQEGWLYVGQMQLGRLRPWTFDD